MNKTMLLFVAGAAIAWGVFAPVVQTASARLGSKLAAFLFVGVAYGLFAVAVPAVLIFVLRSDPTVSENGSNYNISAVAWGVSAGVCSAVGALCLILAVARAGPGGEIYVAPLVFAGAPIVNTVATLLWFQPTRTWPDWRFLLGILLAATGAALVLWFRPVDTPADADAPVVADQSTE